MKFLFLCVANSARSQLAEALAKEILGGSHEIHSAGSHPASEVNPNALFVLREKGIEPTGCFPKHWDQLPLSFLKDLDYVITLCAEEVCPVLNSKAKRLHWGLPDPAAVKGDEAAAREAFRRTRNAIESHLREFKASF